jgi:uncharacterized protein (DUF2141 family)
MIMGRVLDTKYVYEHTNYLCHSMLQLYKYLLSVCSILCLFSACARELTPTGGPSDKVPPRLDSLKSTTNQQTNFQKQDIVFKFDEWLQLKDVANQVFVSPPTAKKPQVTLEGKKVIVRFDESEVLRPQTTYTIHLGNAIQDLNEGNAVKDMRFVFSTGPKIDSLIVTGTVIDAITAQPAKNISVALYSNATDSSIIKSLPDYLAFTDEAGQYQLQNVREGSYTLAAMKDENKNNKWSIQEQVAFADTLILVQNATMQAPPLQLFQSELEQKLIGKILNNFGEIRLTYTNPISDIAVSALSDSITLMPQYIKDTAIIWYDHQRQTDWTLLAGTDTLNIKPLQRASFLEFHKLTFSGVAPQRPSKNKGKGAAPVPESTPNTNILQEQIASIGQPASIPMAFPIIQLDTSRWLCKRVKDSTDIRNFKLRIDSINPTKLVIDFGSSVTEQYRFTLLPGALTDLWGVANTDTLIASFRYFSGEDVGNIHMTLNQLKPGSGYVLELTNAAAPLEPIVFVADGQVKKFELDNLVPGVYTAKITQDKNANGRWDSGNYMQRRQPESIYTQRLDSVKPNWTVDVIIGLEDGPKAPKTPKSPVAPPRSKG